MIPTFAVVSAAVTLLGDSKRGLTVSAVLLVVAASRPHSGQDTTPPLRSRRLTSCIRAVSRVRATANPIWALLTPRGGQVGANRLGKPDSGLRTRAHGGNIQGDMDFGPNGTTTTSRSSADRAGSLLKIKTLLRRRGRDQEADAPLPSKTSRDVILLLVSMATVSCKWPPFVLDLSAWW